MISVFYDGACGLCSKEINHYKAIAPSGVFNWCDVMSEPDSLQGTGITQVDALKALYAKDEQGKLHKGVDAFLLIWSKLRRWRQLVRFVKLPLIYPMARFVYDIFARWRFKRLSHCQVAQKQQNSL